MLHAASNGGCRLVIGRRTPDGGVHVVLDLGRLDGRQPSTSSDSTETQHKESSASTTVKATANSNSSSALEAQQRQQQQDPLADVDFASVQLREGIDTVILGSVGLW